MIEFKILSFTYYQSLYRYLNMKYFVIFSAIIGFAVSEKPAPYPAKGWKPQGARLELPPSRAYGVPRDANNIQITTVANDYLPPATEASRTINDNDFLNVQSLPAPDSYSQFQEFKRQPLKSQARIVMAPSPAFASQPILLSPVFAPQFAVSSQQFREEKFGQLAPKNNAKQLLSQEYGPPKTEQQDTTEFPQRNEPERPQNNNSSEEEDESDEEASDENDDKPVIAVANAETYAKQQAVAQQGQYGQYYILLPDNSLQKVRYATGQSEEDRQINGFSAQLR